MEQNKYDILIIGGGPGGYEAAFRASALGLKTAVVEKEHIGGTCLNHGCIPTKTLLHAAKWYRNAKEFDAIGLHANDVRYDSERMHERKEEVIRTLRNGIFSSFHSRKIDYWNGTATITGRHQVEIQVHEQSEDLKAVKKIIHAENLLIATGAKTVIPPICGIELPGVYTSEQMLEKEICSQKTLIIGGGVIGMEFATMLSGFGSEVIVVEAEKRILPLFDREIAQKLSLHLKKKGIQIKAGVQVEKIQQMKKDEKDILLVHTSDGLSTETEAVLVSVGRKPNIDGLFSENFMQAEGASLKIEKGRLLVDHNYETSITGIYAAGDVTGGVQLAHMAAAEGICAVESIAKVKHSMNLEAVPSCIYSDPEIASVGMTPEEAKSRGLLVKTGKYLMTANGKAYIENQQSGFIRVTYMEETGVVIGAQMMCERATDLISELATAVVNQLTVEQLISVIRPHPTFCEGIGLALR